MLTASNKALLLEQRVGQIISAQEYFGVAFNKQAASFLLHKIHEHLLLIDLKAVPQLPVKRIVGGAYKKAFKKNGDLQNYVVNYCDSVGLKYEEIGGVFTRVSYVPFDTSSNDDVKTYLLSQGWIPQNWNVKESKELTTEAKAKEYVYKYFVNEEDKTLVNHRLRMLKFTGRRTINRLLECIFDRGNKLRGIPTSPKFPDNDKEMEEEFKNITGTIPALMKERVKVSHRRGFLQGLIDRCWWDKDEQDWKLSAGANSNATPTCRMRHRVVVNCPAARTMYGKQLRKLFISRRSKRTNAVILHNKKHKLSKLANKLAELGKVSVTDAAMKLGISFSEVYKLKREIAKGDKIYIPARRMVWIGADAAGLELRILAHHMNDPIYTDTLLNGDIHTVNQQAAGLPTRDDAKKFIYAAILYGGGDALAGGIIGGDAKAGKRIKKRFFDATPALARLMEKTKAASAKGYLKGIDGRRYLMRKFNGQVQTHKALNTLLQGNGSVSVKYWTVFLANLMKRFNRKYYQHLHMHDELHYCVEIEDIDTTVGLMHKAIERTTEYLKVNLPLEVDPIVGANWLDCH